MFQGQQGVWPELPWRGVMYFLRSLKNLVAITACLLLSLNASAQGSKGTIRGRVTDPSGGALVGAQIILEQNGVSVVSDAQGQFFINNLEPGSYTVEVSYVGFTPFKKDVAVAAGRGPDAERRH